MATFYGNIQKIISTPINPDILAWYEFENNFDDSTANGYNLNQNGTVPFATSPVPPFGTYEAGVFSDANYYSGPTALNTALSNPANGIFFEAYVYITSLTNQPVLEYKTVSGLAQWYQVLTTGAVKMHWGGTPTQSAAGAFNINEWTYIAYYANSGNGDSKVWCSPASSISQTPVAQSNYNTTQTTVASSTIGRYLPATTFSLNTGYMADAKYSLTEPSTLPLSLV